MRVNKIKTVFLASIFFASTVSFANESENSRDPASDRTAVNISQEDAPDFSGKIFENDKRYQLYDHGYNFDLIYKTEYNRNLSGGLKQDDSFLNNADIKFTIDAEKAFLLKNTTFFIYGLYNSGNKASQNVGDAQVTSNIETQKEFFKLYEIWVQKNFFDNKFSVLLGVHDLNSEFYVTDASTAFFNNSFGTAAELSQTAVNGPSIFPSTSPAVRFKVKLADNINWLLGFFEAAAGNPDNVASNEFQFDEDDGLLAITEVQLKDSSTQYSLGLWTYTKGSPDINDAGNHKSQGLYTTVNKNFNEHLSGFLRVGFATPKTERFQSNQSLGIVFSNLNEKLKDSIGLAVTAIQNGSSYKHLVKSSGDTTKPGEETFEVYYKFSPWRGVIIQPDFQYIINPDTSTTVRNAFDSALRLTLDF